MDQTNFRQTELGEIVAKDFRTASLFKEVGIDFCCGGKKSLQVACDEKAVDVDAFIVRIRDLAQTPISPTQNFNDWNLSFLIDYITNTHHKYVIKTLPELLFYTQKIAQVHGEHHPELWEVADLFDKINTELLQHLKHEEEVLFPAIKKALVAKSVETTSIIVSEIERMATEHEFAGGAMDTINAITNNYQTPADACNTYKVALNLLSQFEDDLHIHVHLENNIIYPKALLLSK
jgi:regulator of cell morphogenesis and NO signaling